LRWQSNAEVCSSAVVPFREEAGLLCLSEQALVVEIPFSLDAALAH